AESALVVQADRVLDGPRALGHPFVVRAEGVEGPLLERGPSPALGLLAVLREIGLAAQAAAEDRRAGGHGVLHDDPGALRLRLQPKADADDVAAAPAAGESLLHGRPRLRDLVAARERLLER